MIICDYYLRPGVGVFFLQWLVGVFYTKTPLKISDTYTYTCTYELHLNFNYMYVIPYTQILLVFYLQYCLRSVLPCAIASRDFSGRARDPGPNLLSQTMAIRHRKRLLARRQEAAATISWYSKSLQPHATTPPFRNRIRISRPNQRPYGPNSQNINI